MTAPAAAEAKLLVVDDEPNILELLSASLRFAGFEVASAANGVDALRLARSFRPDLLVLDVMMPEMDGFDLVRRLRSEGSRTPVVFLTARAMPGDRERCIAAGALSDDDVADIRGNVTVTAANTTDTIRSDENRMQIPPVDDVGAESSVG